MHYHANHEQLLPINKITYLAKDGCPKNIMSIINYKHVSDFHFLCILVCASLRKHLKIKCTIQCMAQAVTIFAAQCYYHLLPTATPPFVRKTASQTCQQLWIICSYLVVLWKGRMNCGERTKRRWMHWTVAQKFSVHSSASDTALPQTWCMAFGKSFKLSTS